MNTSKQLDYVAGKLGLIPAFGDTIGKAVNKAELSLCQRYAKDAQATHNALLAALIEVTAQHDAMLATIPQGFGWGRLVTDEARKAIAVATANG